MNWKNLQNENDLAALKERSVEIPQVIFKHSTRCSISSMAKNRLERAAPALNVEFNLLDLIKYRELSQKIADDFSVEHESPQILFIKNGECMYDESHSGISMDEIAEQAVK